MQPALDVPRSGPSRLSDHTTMSPCMADINFWPENRGHWNLQVAPQIINVYVVVAPTIYQQSVAIVMPNRAGTGNTKAVSTRWHVRNAPFLACVPVTGKHVAGIHGYGLARQLDHPGLIDICNVVGGQGGIVLRTPIVGELVRVAGADVDQPQLTVRIDTHGAIAENVCQSDVSAQFHRLGFVGWPRRGSRSALLQARVPTVIARKMTIANSPALMVPSRRQRLRRSSLWSGSA